MSHEIDLTTGRAAVFVTQSSGGPAWHGLGTVVQDAATSREAIHLAGLDWKVQQWPLQAIDDHRHSAVHRHVANVRTDTGAVLGVVGRQYTPIQNVECFDFMDALVGDKLAMFHTAGSLKEGRTIWMLARIPKEYHAGDHDVIHPYVLLVNSHDGSSSLRMIATTVRVVCNNTLNLALNRATGSEGISIHHRPSLEMRVREARQRLGIVAARFDQFDEELHRMLEVQPSARQVNRYFKTVIPPLPDNATARQQQSRREMLDRLDANLEAESNTLPGIRGTAWAAYNAVSQWADHQRSFRGTDDHQRAENRLQSVWFGSSNDIKQKAYDLALAGIN
ncbi:MAG: DUF932 domain-containing protein [Phycisphaerales bacterium]